MQKSKVLRKTHARIFLSALFLQLTVNASHAQWVRTIQAEGMYSCTSSGSSTFCGSFQGGILRSSDYGWSWSPVNNGLIERIFKGVNTVGIWSMASYGGVIFAGTSEYGVERSINNGDLWSLSNNGLGDTVGHSLSVNSFAASDSTIFVASVGSIFRSKDTGKSWIPFPTTGSKPFFPYFMGLASINNNIFAFSGDSVFRSIGGVTSWSKPTTKLNKIGYGLHISDIAVGASYAFLATSNGIYRSPINGKTWESASNGLDSTLDTLSVDPLGPKFNYTLINKIIVDGNNIFAASNGNPGLESGTIYISNKEGSAWTKIRSDGLPNGGIVALAVSGNYLLAGGSGIWRLAIPGSSISKRPPISKKSEFGFDSDLGNLLHSGSRINFTTKSSGSVILNIYDTRGNKTASLINAILPSGTYQGILNGTGLSKGVYFLNLQTTRFNQMHRFLFGQ